MKDILLTVKNLTIGVHDDVRYTVLVDDISFDVAAQSTTAIVGGSGSGKTTTAKAIVRLLDPALRLERGEILYDKQDLLKYSEKQMRSFRGKEVGFIFQEPLYAFNPLFTIGHQIKEVFKYHTNISRRNVDEKIWTLLDVVGLDNPKQIARSYPHHLSGGMRQRAMIAQAMAAEPKLIIADEPTSNLDVVHQAQIISVFQKLRKEFDVSLLLITHDLGMVKHMADDVAVMKQGKIIEMGLAQDVLDNPQHVYTQKLMEVL